MAHRAGQLTGVDLRKSHLAMNPSSGRSALVSGARAHMLVDNQSRLMVRIVLDGSVPMSNLRGNLRTLGVAVTATDPNWRAGVMEAYLPLEQAETVAQLPGVLSVHLVHAPRTRVGSVTSQGAAALKTDQANKPGVVSPNGITGKGITIGILSDSWDMSGLTPAAVDDVKTGDLPNQGVPDGRPGLKFLSDAGDVTLGGDPPADEGRAMGGIAFDMAPSASFCFATAVYGPISFANNIRRMRTDSQCAADILVDDTSYLDEPAFSDGPIAIAVNDVTSSGALAGRPVTYVAAAGNDGGLVYSSDLRMMADADSRALTGQPVDLTTIPASIDTSGGFHNFNPDPNGTPAVSQLITVSQALPGEFWDLLMQWDDPFDLKDGVTTDLNLLIFNAAGRFLGPQRPDNNFSTQAPFEGVGLSGNSQFRLVIARTGKGTQLAKKVMWVEDNQFVALSADYVDNTTPAIYGHAGAKGALSIGAYVYDSQLNSSQGTPELEKFSSGGPVSVCCDAKGNRLDAMEIRQKPDVSGVDGVDTTFFGNAGTVSTSSTFFGTSAAAPHIAGVVALLLEAAGGPGSLTPDQVRSKLIASTGTHDLDPFFSKAVLGSGDTTVTVTAVGGDDFGQDGFDVANISNKKFFTVQFTSATAGQTLASLAIDLGNTGIYFNTSRATGFAMAVGSSSDGVQATSVIPAGTRPTTLTLTLTGMQPGGSLQFGIGRSQRSNARDGLSADLLGGATVTATLANPAATLTGTFVNNTGTGYAPGGGWGLVDAVKAIQAK